MNAGHRLQFSDAYWFQEGPGLRNWQFTSSGIKILNVGNIMPDGSIDLSRTDRHLSKAEFDSKYSHFGVESGDLVIASSGISFDEDGLLRTKIAFVGDEHLPLCMNTSTIRFKAKEDLSDLRYLRHWLQSDDFRRQVSRLVTGSAQLNFGPGHLKQMAIRLPPLDEQRRIAAILDKADALRQKRKRAIALLAEMQSSLAARLAFSNEGREVSIEDVADLQIGFAFKSEGYTSVVSDVRLCRGTNVLPGSVDWTDLARWSSDNISPYRQYELNNGDIVVAMDRPWISSGFKVAMIAERDLPALLVQRVARIRARSARDRFYLYHVLRSGEFTRHCRPTETTIPHISPKDFRSFQFHWPSDATLDRYALGSERLRESQTAMENALAIAEALFASLQHRAFSGQL